MREDDTSNPDDVECLSKNHEGELSRTHEFQGSPGIVHARRAQNGQSIVTHAKLVRGRFRCIRSRSQMNHHLYIPFVKYFFSFIYSLRAILLLPTRRLYQERGEALGGKSERSIESGPKFNINEKVLVLDATRTQQLQNQNSENSEPPLFAATIKRSELRHVDSLTRKVMSETKFAFSKKRGRRRFHSQLSTQQNLPTPDQEKEWCYLVHFQGWNSRHDRWMPEVEVFHNTPENRKRLGSNNAKIVRAVKVESAKEKKKKLARTKKALEDHYESGESIADPIFNRLRHACSLPFTLQTILVDDRDKITEKIYPSSSLFVSGNPMETYKRGITMLHVLPSTMNIQSILARYIEAKKREDLEKFARERGNSVGNNQGVIKKSYQQEHCSKDTDTEKRIKLVKSNDEDQNKTPENSQLDKTTLEPQSNKLTPKEMLKIRKKRRKEFALSMLGLVDMALPNCLLYTEERRQYVQIMSALGDDSKDSDDAPNDVTPKVVKRPSEIYGGEHLLRLFIRMPYLLTFYQTAKQDIDTKPDVDPSSENDSTPTVEEEIVEMAEFLSEFIVYLQKNRDECFKERYYAVSTELSENS